VNTPILYALASNIFFSAASLVFAEFSRKHSSMWMNAFKASLGFSVLLLVLPFLGQLHALPSVALACLMLSGLLGLCIGDVFLFNAYRVIGAGRTLMLFGIHPLILGTMAYFLFGQAVDTHRFLGIFFFVACLLIFSFEARKSKGHWEWNGLIWALVGVLFDCSGVLLTRFAFDQSPGITSLEANFYRFSGALIGFLFVSWFVRPIRLFEGFRSETPKRRGLVIIASVCGTLVSLALYLAAIQQGHLATISGIAITAPLFATLLECAIAKKWPSGYLWAALVSFTIGFWIVVG